MNIIYLGAEVPSNRVLLEQCGVRHFGFSFYRAWKRGLPKTKEFRLSDYFDDGAKIYVYNGAPDDHNDPEYWNLYTYFLQENYDDITLVYGEGLGYDPKTIHLWDASTGRIGLEKLVDEDCQHIGIKGEDIDTNPFLAAATQSLAFEDKVQFHAIAAAKPDNLRQVRAETASTMSWLSPMMRGETIVWDGTRLVRYPKRMQEQARPRYAHIYEKAGLDFDKILSNDAKEVSKLAIWSYQQYEVKVNNMSRNLYDKSEESYDDDYAENALTNVDNKDVQVRKLNPRSEGEVGMLPVFGYDISTVVEQDEEGRDVLKDVPVIRSQATSLRMCDTCFVASNCPAFKPQSTCAFKLPVEVKTKDQLKALINAIIEMQGQRVAFARFSEEINGGYPDPNVSQEIDRLFKLIKTTKELDDSREFIRMTVERQGSSGVLSALFGDRAQTLRELPDGGLNESQTTQIIKGQIED